MCEIIEKAAVVPFIVNRNTIHAVGMTNFL